MSVLPNLNRTLIMGIVNVTPDSFSDGGDYYDAADAVSHTLELINEGADIIDFGANSTRPGAVIVSADEELSRLAPVFEKLENKENIPVSVDTFYTEVASFCLQNGAKIINDVSGTFNSEIASLCIKNDACLVVTHNPENADTESEYPDGVTADVRKFFLDCIQKAAAMGFPLENLILDPGIGFSKSRDDDIELLRNMQWLKMRPCPLLCGVSRKRVTAYDGNAPKERDYSTCAANTAAVLGGADIIRVHNVKAAKGVCAVAGKIYRNGI
ncbi:MAG: dihydropteroate synthase [Clostridia bacterium]|nr:dihydropteroate synthase [Clostridia bacterium]